MSDSFIETKFTDLDSKFGGLQRGALTVIASRPVIGKTSFALSICKNIMLDKKILYFSLSESKEMIINKILRQSSCNDLLPYSNRSSQLFMELEKRLESYQFIISGDYLNFEELKFRLDLAINDDYDLIVVDGFQELSINTSSSAYDVMKANNSMLCYFKRIARENNVAFILTSNCSRKCEERSGHRPYITDFNDCEMEAYANMLLLLLRRDYYDPYDRPGCVELIIAKSFLGAEVVNLMFDKKTCLFSNRELLELTSSKDAEFRMAMPQI